MSEEPTTGDIHIGDVRNESPAERGAVAKTILAAVAGAGLLGAGAGLAKMFWPQSKTPDPVTKVLKGDADVKAGVPIIIPPSAE